MAKAVYRLTLFNEWGPPDDAGLVYYVESPDPDAKSPLLAVIDAWQALGGQYKSIRNLTTAERESATKVWKLDELYSHIQTNRRTS